MGSPETSLDVYTRNKSLSKGSITNVFTAKMLLTPYTLRRNAIIFLGHVFLWERGRRKIDVQNKKAYRFPKYVPITFL